MKKIENEIFDQRDKNVINGQTFDNIRYIDARFWGGVYENCTWMNCVFNRTAFTHGITFSNCRFMSCGFEKQHTWINAFFLNCSFNNCLFDKVLTDGSRFEKCVISGIMKDLIFYGEDVDEDHKSIFLDVDLSGVKFDFTDFRKRVNLSTVKFATEPGDLFIEGERETGSGAIS